MPERDDSAERGDPASPATLASSLGGLLLSAAVLLPGPLAAQYSLEAPSGHTVSYDTAAVEEMLERTRRLRRQLEQDPVVIYYVGTGESVETEEPGPAYPWRAITVDSDSAVRVVTPGNHREASRAYYNYAVEKMELVRGGSSASSCSVSVERTADLVSAFVDGWVVSRLLYGAPALAPVDLLAFARQADHLPASLVSLEDSPVSERCRTRWRRDYPESMEAYRDWRRRVFERGPAREADAPADEPRERSLRAVE